MNAIPVAMPMRSDASRSFGVATAIRCHAESPGFRRGLFVRRATTRGKKPWAEARGHREHAASPATITQIPHNRPTPLASQPGRKPGDTGYECHPARHADAV